MFATPPLQSLTLSAKQVILNPVNLYFSTESEEIANLEKESNDIGMKMRNSGPCSGLSTVSEASTNPASLDSEVHGQGVSTKGIPIDSPVHSSNVESQLRYLAFIIESREFARHLHVENCFGHLLHLEELSLIGLDSRNDRIEFNLL